MSAESHLAFALDFPNFQDASVALDRVNEYVGYAKIGLELFIREGSPAVRKVRQLGTEVFLDLKLHDIPATVERAVAAAAALDVSLLTVHASGGSAMLTAAVRRAERENPRMKLVAVTVLTSLDEPALRQVGVASPPALQAERLARMAWNCGVRAFVCSPNEAAALRAVLGPEAYLITPGIRPSSSRSHDQKRVSTPTDAIIAGSNLLVIGRPIRDARDRQLAARSIRDEVAAALASIP